MIAGGIHPFLVDASLKNKKKEFDKEYVLVLTLFDRMTVYLNFLAKNAYLNFS